MRGKQFRLFVWSGAFGLFGWAIGELVQPLDWLPWITAPLSAAIMCICAARWLIDLIREKTRKALPGFGVHMAIQINQGIKGRRRYVFQLGTAGRQGAALYISASERLVFEVRDTAGEPYPIELALGRKGLPIGEPIYLGAEAGRDGPATIMRVVIDGHVASERRLPFAIDFGKAELDNFTMGANHGGEDHGDFALNNLAVVETTLAERDARGMAQFQRKRAESDGGAVVFGSDGSPTFLSTKKTAQP